MRLQSFPLDVDIEMKNSLDERYDW